MKKRQETLFAAQAPRPPLADRMRPRTLDEFVGQEHVVGPGRLLRRAIQMDRLASIILYGPPGTGKTTLARVIAATTKCQFLTINAVLGGVKDIRESIESARELRESEGRGTILFIDEVHRFNKAQQDALLPWVENGMVVLVGATTENPFFEVNKALVSRSRIFQLRPLEDRHVRAVLEAALADPGRGYGGRAVRVDEDAMAHLVDVAGGDARSALGALELAVETTPPDAGGTIRVTLAVAEESIQQRAVLYDKEGDVHFDVASAFIKSVRGTDPDAALYWLARMVHAGEDPRFILRRLLILAGEDVGMADPAAIGIVEACAAAFDRVGMPEGRFHLAHATLYLATRPKSNSAMGFFDALAAVDRESAGEVPTHLKDASRDREGFGHGAGYQYPHAFRDHWIAQQYLPAGLQGAVFYQPSNVGEEGRIAADVARRREAQLGAAVEGSGLAPPEVLTFGPRDRAQDRWLQRTMSRVGDRLAGIRDRVFELAACERHHLVLDLAAGSGLLTWEALRRVPEGGVWARAGDEAGRAELARTAEALGVLARPELVACPLEHLPAALEAREPGLRFDRLVGRNVLGPSADRGAVVPVLAGLVREGAVLVLAETVGRETQRLLELLPAGALPDDLAARVAAGEASLYARARDPLLDWAPEDLGRLLETEGLAVEVVRERASTDVHVTRAVVDRWFTPRPDRTAFVDRAALSAADASAFRAAIEAALLERTVPWASTIAYLRARRG